jgi:hypothetical protein
MQMLSHLAVFQVEGLLHIEADAEPAGGLPGRGTYLVCRQMLSQLSVFHVRLRPRTVHIHPVLGQLVHPPSNLKKELVSRAFFKRTGTSFFVCQSKKADRDILHPLEPEVHLVDHVPHEVGEDLSVLGGLQLMDSLHTNKQKFRQITDHPLEKA